MSAPTFHPTEALSAYLDGELQAAARADVDEHLGGCSECTTLLDDLRRLAALQASELIPPVPVGLADKIRERLSHDADGPVERAARRGEVLPLRAADTHRRRRPWWMGAPLAAAASVAAAAVIWTAWQAGSDDGLRQSPVHLPPTAPARVPALAQEPAPAPSPSLAPASAPPSVPAPVQGKNSTSSGSGAVAAHGEATRLDGAPGPTRRNPSTPTGRFRNEVGGIDTETNEVAAPQTGVAGEKTAGTERKEAAVARGRGAFQQSAGARKKIEERSSSSVLPVDDKHRSPPVDDGNLQALGAQTEEETRFADGRRAGAPPRPAAKSDTDESSRSLLRQKESMAATSAQEQASPAEDAQPQTSTRRFVGGEDDADQLGIVTHDMLTAAANDAFRSGAGGDVGSRGGDSTLPLAVQAMLAPRSVLLAAGGPASNLPKPSDVDFGVTSRGFVDSGGGTDELRKSAAALLSTDEPSLDERLFRYGGESPRRSVVLQALGLTLFIDELGSVLLSNGPQVCFVLPRFAFPSLPAEAPDGAGRAGDETPAGEDDARTEAVRGRDLATGAPVGRESEPSAHEPGHPAAAVPDAAEWVMLPAALRTDLDALFALATSQAAWSGTPGKGRPPAGYPAESSRAPDVPRRISLYERDGATILFGRDVDAADTKLVDEFARWIETLLEAHYDVGALNSTCTELLRGRVPGD